MARKAQIRTRHLRSNGSLASTTTPAVLRHLRYPSMTPEKTMPARSHTHTSQHGPRITPCPTSQVPSASLATSTQRQARPERRLRKLANRVALKESSRAKALLNDYDTLEELMLSRDTLDAEKACDALLTCARCVVNIFSIPIVLHATKTVDLEKLKRSQQPDESLRADRILFCLLPVEVSPGHRREHLTRDVAATPSTSTHYRGSGQVSNTASSGSIYTSWHRAVCRRAGIRWWRLQPSSDTPRITIWIFRSLKRSCRVVGASASLFAILSI